MLNLSALFTSGHLAVPHKTVTLSLEVEILEPPAKVSWNTLLPSLLQTEELTVQAS